MVCIGLGMLTLEEYLSKERQPDLGGSMAEKQDQLDNKAHNHVAAQQTRENTCTQRTHGKTSLLEPRCGTSYAG